MRIDNRKPYQKWYQRWKLEKIPEIIPEMIPQMITIVEIDIHGEEMVGYLYKQSKSE